MSKMLNKTDLLDIANCACFMGSGGAGPLSTGLNLVNSLPGSAKVELVNIDQMMISSRRHRLLK